VSRYHDIERVKSFADIAEAFVARAHQMVWCNVATVDRRGRPRSRLLHAIWDGESGWIVTRRDCPKTREIAHDPHVSVAYVGDITKPVYADCLAETLDDPATKARVWELFRAAPPPLGYDPEEFFGKADDPEFGVIKLTPWRVEVTNWPVGSSVWRRPAG
jgi:general stress protein 26